jgi:uncharacterized protein YraI
VSALRGRWLRSGLIAMALLVAIAVPASAQHHIAPGDRGLVADTDGDGVNVRSERSLNSGIHFVAPEGTHLTVTSGPIDENGLSWYGVNIDGVDAWIVAEFVSRLATNSGDVVQVVDTNGHGLRLRSDASLDSDTLTVIPEGATAEVIGADRVEGSVVWVNLSYNGISGYSHSGYLSRNGGVAQVASEPVVEEAPAPAPQEVSTNGVGVGGNAKVSWTNGAGVNVRHGAGYGHSVVTVAPEGDVMRVLDGPSVDGDGVPWWNVDYKGLNGWVHGGYVQGTSETVTEPVAVSGSSTDSGSSEATQAPAASSVGQQIVNVAMQFQGYPYVWGGTTPSGFDCSGFLYYVVNQVTGGGFPRAMEAQVNRGAYVPADQLQPGDLVFQQNTYQWGLSHAGIYIGNGQFIHASTPGSGVIISNLWDSYWGQRYYTARRIQ